MTPLQRFAHNLRAIREDCELSQEELGFRSGLHRTEISRLELSEREPRLKTLVKLAIGLGISVDDLCDGIEWDTDSGEFSVAVPLLT